MKQITKDIKYFLKELGYKPKDFSVRILQNQRVDSMIYLVKAKVEIENIKELSKSLFDTFERDNPKEYTIYTDHLNIELYDLNGDYVHYC